MNKELQNVPQMISTKMAAQQELINVLESQVIDLSMMSKISMKRLLRIMIGLPLSPIPMFLGTWIWLWTNNMPWVDAVGYFTWHLASGDWDKLPE